MDLTYLGPPRLEKAADDGAMLRGGRLPDVHHRGDIPERTDVRELPPYKARRHTLNGKQAGNCAGCGIYFPFRNLTLDHIFQNRAEAPTTWTICSCCAEHAIR